jgi:hypothetical protein
MFQLKPISEEGIPRSLEKAQHYRLLNEPSEAESICLDILEIDPDNQQALVTLLLSRTDQFDTGKAVEAARDLLPQLRSEYEQAYYAGLICERRGKAILQQGGRNAHFMTYDWIVEAMTWYEKAERLRPPGNEDAVLRWNTCARILKSHPEIGPEPHEERYEPPLE